MQPRRRPTITGTTGETFQVLLLAATAAAAVAVVQYWVGWDTLIESLTGRPEPIAAAGTFKHRRARNQWLQSLGADTTPIRPDRKRKLSKNEELFEQLLTGLVLGAGVTWKQLRDQSWVDEAAAVLLAATVTGFTIAAATSDPISGYGFVTGAASAAALTAGLLVLFGSPRGRAYVKRCHIAASKAHYIETAIVRHFATQWVRAAQFPKGKAPTLVPGSVWVSGQWVNPGPDYPPSILPIGEIPTQFGFQVKPPAIDTTDPDKLATATQGIAERFRSITSYRHAQGVGDPGQIVDIALTFNDTTAITSTEHPVNPANIGDRFPTLMVELDLADKRGQVPQLTEWRYTTPPPVKVLTPASDAVLDSVPEVIEGAVMPTPLQTSSNDHDRILARLAARIGMAEVEADNYRPEVGVGFTMWRDGKPALLPASYPDLVTNFDAAMTEVFTGATVPPPRLISHRAGPTTPEPGEGTWLEEAESILIGDRPEHFTWQLGLADPNDAAATVRILSHRLGMHKADFVQVPSKGLLLRAIRSPLPLGELVDLERLGTDYEGAMVLGRTPGGLLLLPYRDRPHTVVTGETGSGKGELLALQGVGALLRDWVWFFLNPKPNSDMSALMGAAIDIRAAAQRAACLELATMEIKLRAWKLDSITDRVNVVDELLEGGRLSVRDFRHYAELSAENVAAGGEQFPPIGPPLLLQHDESAEDLLTSPDMAEHASSIARLARFVGFMLTLATQNPSYDALGGGQVVANIGNHFILRTNKSEMLNPLGGPTKPDAITLMSGPGKGHNFHKTVRDPDDPFTSLTQFTEGQLAWAGKSVNWIAAQVVSPYLNRNPDVVTEDRDFVADLKAAKDLFGGAIERADFAGIDHDRYPYILGPAPLTGPRGLLNLPTRTAAERDALNGHVDVAEVIRHTPPHPDAPDR